MRIATLLLVLFVSFFSLNAWAADVPTQSWDKRFTLRAGAIAYNLDGKFSSTKEGQPKVKVDADDLGLDENKIDYTLGASLRMGKRWRLHLDYMRYHDDETQAVSQEIEYGDFFAPAEARVKSKLHIDLYVVNLSYDLYRSERAYFGIGLGAHVVDFDLKVSGTATVDGSEIDLGNEGEDLTAPLPNVNVSGVYAFKDNWLLNYSGGWMSMSYDDYDGDLYFARSALEYWPHKNVGVGAGYTYLSVDVDYKTNKKKETYDVDLSGPVVYVVVGF